MICSLIENDMRQYQSTKDKSLNIPSQSIIEIWHRQIRKRLVLHVCALWGHNIIVLIYLGIGYSCKCNRRLCFTDGTGNSFALDRPPRNPIGSMTVCLWESDIRVGVFGLNLRLAPLILTTINILWLRSSRALTGSVYANTGYIGNHGVLGVMSRRKYHSSHSGDDVT